MQKRGDIEPEVGGLQSKKQIANAKYRTKRQQQQQLTQAHNSNVADQYQTIHNMVQSHECVQKIASNKDKVPRIILFTDDQIQDVKRFCCSAPSSHTTVLGVDKTFNLGDVHVTLAVFKNLAVKRRDTNEHPIFAGPLFLHGNSDYKTYLSFFSHLTGMLQGTTSQPIFGTDDEIAMKQAIKTAFPNSSTLSCTMHLKQNIEEHLRDKIGIRHCDRSTILASIFGPVGVTAAENETIFNGRLETTKEIYTATAPAFEKYFTERVTPLLRSNFATSTSSPSTASLDNNCESMNAILKHGTDWKSLPLPDLVLKLHDVVRAQYQDVRRALAGQGDYVLCPQFAKFDIPIHIIMDKIKTAKARKLLQEIPKTNFSNQPEDNNVERQGTYRDGVSQRREKAWPGEKKEMRKDNKRCKEIASMSVPDYIPDTFNQNGYICNLFTRWHHLMISSRIYTHIAPRQNGKMAAHTRLTNKKRILR